ncbi:GNAT family N-acetyltransferase [Flavobacterium sp. JP2137]|uniref:GNAT family N-acetyltransferase n=1 Tax=Flavobacterium sp. JP2137 TaxID=3414510 RepID=UPI003D2FAAD5
MTRPFLQYRFLNQTPTAVVLNTFNEAFSDYILPMHLTEAQWAYKLKNDGVDWSLSLGAFDGEALVGVILHGRNQKEFYNAGTGVIPSHRGQGITRALYAFGLPLLQEQGFEVGILEVISTNDAAKRTYEKIGFEKTAVLNCYNGTISAVGNGKAVTLQPLTPELYQAYYADKSVAPSWQNDRRAVLAHWEILEVQQIYSEQTAVGYLVYHPQSNKLIQLYIAPEFRRKGLATALLSSLFTADKKLLVTNVNSTDTALNTLFKKLGLQLFLKQDLMVLNL